MTSMAQPAGPFSVAERIISARKRKGISQERLAELIGTSRRHMIRIEKGQHRPGPTFLGRIAEATDQPLSFFAEEEADDDDEEADAAMRDAFALFVNLMDSLGARRVAAPETRA